MKKRNFISKAKCCMLIVHVRSFFLFKGLFLLFILCALNDFEVKAAPTAIIDGVKVPALTYDEFPVRVIVEGYSNFYVDAIFTNDELLFVNINHLFQTLGIPCIAGQNGDHLDGFIENESRTYSIDYNASQIKVGAKTINAKNGLVKDMGSLYVESSLFAEAFGIILTFNFRALTVILKSNFELPFIKQLRIEKMRSNISKLKGEIVADTIVGRNYHLLKLGTMDWSVASSQTGNGSIFNNFGLGIGTELLFGEANVSVNYSNQYKFDSRQVQYLWRWVDNTKSIIKQAQLGKISSQTISFIKAPIIGGIIRNSPTTVRKATGYYTITEYTEPNWSVELYINDVLVDYTKADASGLYVFKVPIVYGYITLKLKFYGTMSEERTEERTMNTPYTIMPAKEFDYSLSGGVVQDSTLSQFGKGEFNYGVNRFITIGGGLEYLSSITNSPFIPYAKMTIQPFSKLLINAEYAHGVKTRGLLNYYLGKNTLLQIDYTKYVEGQQATLFNAPEERKVKLSVPFRLKKLSGFAKLDYTQLVYKTSNINQGTVMLSAYYKQLSANSSTQLNWNDQRPASVISNLALSYRLKKGYQIRSSAQYNANENKLVTINAAIEKRIPKGNFSISYVRDILNNNNHISLNFKYDLPFARTYISASQTNGMISTSESAQGSLAFGGGNNYIHASNNSSVGKGGISLYPFLDLNNNGVFDKGEPMVKLTSVRVSGGKAIFSKKDSIVRIPDLNAFVNYNVEFSDTDLDNISWRFKHNTYQVLIDPNQFKRIDIPIISVGEVSGMTYMKTDSIMEGIGRILVKFYKKNSTKVVAETLSESDGYIYYLGLEPGNYVARVDTTQMSKLDFKADLQQIDFTIKTLREGDIVGGVDFVLSRNKIKEKPIEKILVPIDKTLTPKEKSLIPNERIVTPNEKTFVPVKKAIVPNEKGNQSVTANSTLSEKASDKEENSEKASEQVVYKVQVGVFEKEVTPKELMKLNSVSTEVLANGTIRYFSGNFNNIKDAVNAKNELLLHGIKGAFVVAFYDNKRISLPEAKAINKKNTTVPLEDASQKSQRDISNPNTSITVAGTEEQYGNSPEEGLIFRNQLLALKRKVTLSDPFFKGLKNIKEYFHNGMYKYTTGESKSIKEANKDKNKLRSRGFHGTFVVPFYHNRRISREEAEVINKKDTAVPLKPAVPLEGTSQKLQDEISDANTSIATGGAEESYENTPEEGLIFKNQLLALKRKVALSDPFFKGLKNIKEYFHKGMYKYTTGESKLIEEANKDKNKLRSRGFHGTFVVPFYHNRRISREEAEVINKKDTAVPLKPDVPLEGTSQKLQDEISDANTSIATGGAEESYENTPEEGLIFKNQLLALKRKVTLSDPFFKGLKNIKEYFHKGMYKYTTGESKSMEEANRNKNKLRSQGFLNAFVVPFYKDERISSGKTSGVVLYKSENLDGIAGIRVLIYDTGNTLITSTLSEADGTFNILGLKPGDYTAQLDREQLDKAQMTITSIAEKFRIAKGNGNVKLKFILEVKDNKNKQLDEKAAENKLTPPKWLIFRVQIMASKRKQSFYNKWFVALKGIKMYEHEGWYKYTWGETSSLDEIRKIKTDLKNRGFKNAFIVAFYKGMRISMQEATGEVSLNIEGEFYEIGDIKINIYDDNNEFITSILSKSDGHFSFLGLRPGNYTAALDQTQLDSLQLVSNSGSLKFSIGYNVDGDIAEQLKFILYQKTTNPK